MSALVVGGLSVDLGSTDRAYLLEALNQVEALRDRLQLQLTDAKREFAAGGAPSDPDWLIKTEALHRHAGRVAQRIQQRIGEVKEDARRLNREMTEANIKAKSDPAKVAAAAARAARWEQAFVDAARETLPKETFLELCRCAHRTVGFLE